MQENPFVQEVVERLHAATEIPAEQIRSTLSYPPSLDLGDIAFPCFLLAKQRRKSPPEIAGELVDEVFGSPTDHVAGATAAGPYLNISFNRKTYAKWVLRQTMTYGKNFGRSDEGAGRVVAIDYSSPNIAKPFHVGHLRSTIIGGALYRLFNALGYRSVGINHLGDWGTQFGKLIVGLKNWGSEDDLEDVLALNRLYVKYHEEEKNDKTLTDDAREWFRKQEAADPEAMRLWNGIRETSLDYFKRIYVRLGADFDHYTGESYFNDKMDEVVTMATDAGLTEVSDSALIIDLNKHGIKTPALLKKADGSTLYITRDLAAALYRHRTYDFHKLLYVVGSEQALHFQQLFKVCELLGFDWHEDIAHVGFGRVKGMSSRAGNVVYLEELLDQAKSKALEKLHANAETRPALEDEEAVAEAVGIAAIFFSDMSNRRIKDYTFDWDRAISFEGDTGPYLLNAHARIAGIIRKCEVEPCTNPDELRFDLIDEPAAHRLVSLVARYPEALRSAARDYEPSAVATYLLDLAKGLHGSYRELRVKGEAPDLAQARLQLFLAVKQVLANGLAILGIPALERM
jgi:arginyl-tRNA synthetase